ncbi:hypothetical protein OBCHQ24_15710 [Oceanobacillus iheyensis]|nr:hypothetical protein OBCHQ24_15710 [Oceanobacillus iheyensis]
MIHSIEEELQKVEESEYREELKQWDDQFELMYATSRLDQLDTRKPDAERGIKPDVYIPWTPEHINKDIDLEEAMKLIQEK